MSLKLPDPGLNYTEHTNVGLAQVRPNKQGRDDMRIRSYSCGEGLEVMSEPCGLDSVSH